MAKPDKKTLKRMKQMKKQSQQESPDTALTQDPAPLVEDFFQAQPTIDPKLLKAAQKEIDAPSESPLSQVNDIRSVSAQQADFVRKYDRTIEELKRHVVSFLPSVKAFAGIRFFANEHSAEMPDTLVEVLDTVTEETLSKRDLGKLGFEPTLELAEKLAPIAQAAHHASGLKTFESLPADAEGYEQEAMRAELDRAKPIVREYLEKFGCITLERGKGQSPIVLETEAEKERMIEKMTPKFLATADLLFRMKDDKNLALIKNVLFHPERPFNQGDEKAYERYGAQLDAIEDCNLFLGDNYIRPCSSLHKHANRAYKQSTDFTAALMKRRVAGSAGAARIADAEVLKAGKEIQAQLNLAITYADATLEVIAHRRELEGIDPPERGKEIPMVLATETQAAFETFIGSAQEMANDSQRNQFNLQKVTNKLTQLAKAGSLNKTLKIMQNSPIMAGFNLVKTTDEELPTLVDDTRDRWDSLMQNNKSGMVDINSKDYRGLLNSLKKLYYKLEVLGYLEPEARHQTALETYNESDNPDHKIAKKIEDVENHARRAFTPTKEKAKSIVDQFDKADVMKDLTRKYDAFEEVDSAVYEMKDALENMHNLVQEKTQELQSQAQR